MLDLSLSSILNHESLPSGKLIWKLNTATFSIDEPLEMTDYPRNQVGFQRLHSWKQPDPTRTYSFWAESGHPTPNWHGQTVSFQRVTHRQSVAKCPGTPLPKPPLPKLLPKPFGPFPKPLDHGSPGTAGHPHW